jgi:hypothetical protein
VELRRPLLLCRPALIRIESCRCCADGADSENGVGSIPQKFVRFLPPSAEIAIENSCRARPFAVLNLNRGSRPQAATERQHPTGREPIERTAGSHPVGCYRSDAPASPALPRWRFLSIPE